MNFKFKSIALVIGLSAGSIVAPAHAIPVSVEVIGNVSATSNGTTNTDHQGPDSSVYAYAYNENIYGSASGDDSGWSSLSASAYQSYTANNTFSVSSNLRQVATVTNDFSSAQNFTFDFLINQGSLSTSSYTLNTGDYLSASYSATILVNGTSIWSSSANLETTSLGSEITKSGTDLGGYQSTSYYSWSPFSSSISLGAFGAGETFTLEYLINASVGGILSECGYENEHDIGYGYGYGYGCYYNAYAQFGDPFDFNVSPIDDTTITAKAVTAVPEPAGTLLLGAGLLGLAYRRRAKKQQ